MDIKRNTILVPTDFTEVIDFSIEHAAGICKMQNYKMTLFHVINKETKAYLKKEKLTGSTIHEKLDKTIKEIKSKYSVEADFIVREGSIFTSIREVAKEIGANMIILGTHGKVGLQRIVGSYALKVIEKSPVPVIAIQKRGFREGYKNIVLPIDDSAESKQKVKWAIHFAKKFDSKIHLIAIKVSDRERMSKIKANLNQIKKFFSQNGINYADNLMTKTGPFYKQILDFSNELDADMILIMTSPDKILPSFLVGQLEEQIILNELQIPVLAINPVDLNIIVGGM